MDEPYSIGGFTPENYDRKFRGQVRSSKNLQFVYPPYMEAEIWALL
jgi:membrane carboxypeptidase/penicillin-binding protein PbpC